MLTEKGKKIIMSVIFGLIVIVLVSFGFSQREAIDKAEEITIEAGEVILQENEDGEVEQIIIYD